MSDTAHRDPSRQQRPTDGQQQGHPAVEKNQDQPAQEWGERTATGETIASGGKRPAPGADPAQPKS